jgi:hypothetical protein
VLEEIFDLADRENNLEEEEWALENLLALFSFYSLTDEIRITTSRLKRVRKMMPNHESGDSDDEQCRPLPSKEAKPMSPERPFINKSIGTTTTTTTIIQTNEGKVSRKKRVTLVQEMIHPSLTIARFSKGTGYGRDLQYGT